MSTHKTKRDPANNLSVRIASELMSAEAHPKVELTNPKGKKRKYTVSPEGHKVKTNAEQLREHQWKKGQSGNPKGRPVKALSLVNLLRERLQNHPEMADDIVTALIALSTRKDIRAIEMTFDRIDGKVAETHKIEGVVPITLLFRPAEEVLALEQPGVIEGEVREITEGGQIINE